MDGSFAFLGLPGLAPIKGIRYQIVNNNDLRSLHKGKLISCYDDSTGLWRLDGAMETGKS